MIRILALVASFHCINGYLQQQVTFFKEDDCQGEIFETFTSPVPDLDQVSTIVANGVKSVDITGMWGLHFDPNYDVSQGTSMFNGIGCSNISLARKSIRYIGNSDLDRPGLSLYTEIYFGNEEFYFDLTNLSEGKNGVSLNSSVWIGSWGMTGNESWTLFQEPNFKGQAFCVEPVGYFESYLTVFESFVGSVKIGCDPSTPVFNKGMYSEMDQLNIQEFPPLTKN